MKDVHFWTLRGEKAKGGMTLAIKGVVSVFGLSCTIKTVLGDFKIEGNPVSLRTRWMIAG